MKKPTFKFLLALSLLLAITSCVSIIGQRISWFHDAAKDTLKVLIHYDGIHEGTGDANPGADQLPAFINDRDIMILDWWGHLKMGPIRAKLETGNVLEKLVAKTLTSFEVQAVGHYRDPAGRIGALQVITVPKISRLVKSINELISLAVKAGKLGDTSLPRSMQLQKDAAHDRHQWIVLDGHALRFRIPVHPDEAGRMKGTILRRGLYRAFARDTEAHKDLVRRIVDQIADAPVSVILEEELLTLVFGYRERPCTIRISTRDAHNAQLDEVVQKNVPTDLDRGFAAALIARALAPKQGEEPTPMPGLFGDLLRWGPPEDQVGALLRIIADTRAGRGLPQTSAGATRVQATAALAAFGEEWTRRGLTPATPPSNDDPEAYSEAWADWYHVMAGRQRTERER
jgi:hypothetical protein